MRHLAGVAIFPLALQLSSYCCLLLQLEVNVSSIKESIVASKLKIKPGVSTEVLYVLLLIVSTKFPVVNCLVTLLVTVC